MASTTSGTTNDSKLIANEALVKNYPINKEDFLFGLPDDFTRGIYTPNQDVNYLSQFAIANALKNADSTWELYKEDKLTNLRGQISKELAQLNHVTETAKAKIESASNFRNTLRTSLAASLQGFWS